MKLIMTHELLANLMGVRREGIAEAAHQLQVAGLIIYSRGLITLIHHANYRFEHWADEIFRLREEGAIAR